MRSRLRGVVYGVVAFIIVAILGATSVELITLLLLLSLCLCVLYLYAVRDTYRSVTRDNKDLRSANVGDVVEVSGTIVSDDMPESPFFRYETPVTTWAVERSVNRRGIANGVRWDNIVAGHTATPFTIRSENGRKSIVDMEDDWSTDSFVLEYITGIDPSLKIDVSGAFESSMIEPDEIITERLRCFLENKGINIDEYRDVDRSSLLRKPSGTLRFREACMDTSGDVFVRGVLEESNIMDSDVIGFTDDELCIVSDSTKDEYVHMLRRNIYIALSVSTLSLFYLIPYFVDLVV